MEAALPQAGRRRNADLAGNEFLTPFPHGVMLKLAAKEFQCPAFFRLDMNSTRNKDGVYLVSFDSRELVVKGQL